MTAADEPCPLLSVSLWTPHPTPTPATVIPSNPTTSVLWRISASGGIRTKASSFQDFTVGGVGCADRKVRPPFVWSLQTDAACPTRKNRVHCYPNSCTCVSPTTARPPKQHVTNILSAEPSLGICFKMSLQTIPEHNVFDRCKCYTIQGGCKSRCLVLGQGNLSFGRSKLLGPERQKLSPHVGSTYRAQRPDNKASGDLRTSSIGVKRESGCRYSWDGHHGLYLVPCK